MNIKYYIFILTCLFGLNAQAQNEWNTWYFGAGAGLDFNTNPPTVLDGGQINTKEGCASISDKQNGKILFYTDGQRAWNKNHQIMLNGDNLKGHNSAYQSGIIVPRPGWPDRYYLFTADYIGSTQGYYYNEVDMTLDGGLGGIIPNQKNILLYSPNTEKLCAVKHCNGIDYWLITHKANSADFYIYLITQNGVGAPITQTTGSYVANYSSCWASAGGIVASQNSKLIAQSIPACPNTDLNSKIEIFDFDNATGNLSFKYLIDTIGTLGGLAFSPSGHYFYSNSVFGNDYKLYQFNLQAGDSQAIKNSLYVVADASPNYFGALQISPNKDIYVAEITNTATPYPYLSIIHNPNQPGIACNFEHNALNLAPNQSLVGLPNFISNINYNPPIGQVIDTLCPGQSIVVNNTTYDEANPIGVEYLPLSATSGCDSVVVVNLYFHNSIENYSQTLCSGQSIDINGTTFDESNPNGSITLPNATQNGCDSVVNVQLLFLPTIQENYSQTLCSGQSIDINGTTFDESNPNGSITLPNAAQNGCDSIVNVQLLFLPTIQENYSQTLCSGQSSNINGSTFDESNPSGSITLPNAAQNGCDSVINVNITFSQTTIGNYQANFCKGDTIFVNGNSYQYDNPTGSVLLVGAASGGCDSLVNIDLRFYDDTSVIQQTLCIADTLVIAGNTFDFFNPAGIVTLEGAAYSGCDSIIDVNLDFYAVDTTFVQDTICWHDSILVNNHVYSFEKMDGFEVIPTGECDSLVAVQLYSPYDQIPIINFFAKDSICYGETVKLSAFSTLINPIYLWYQNDVSICDSCENVFTPIIRDDKIALIGIDSFGCELVTEREFDVLMNYGVYIPNVFSPNGDGFNDKFTLYANKKGEELLLFQIYDRWGNLVYEAAHKDVQAFKTDGWDGTYKGKIMDTGVYVYQAVVRFIDGELREFSGDVTLVR